MAVATVRFLRNDEEEAPGTRHLPALVGVPLLRPSTGLCAALLRPRILQASRLVPVAGGTRASAAVLYEGQGARPLAPQPGRVSC